MCLGINKNGGEARQRAKMANTNLDRKVPNLRRCMQGRNNGGNHPMFDVAAATPTPSGSILNTLSLLFQSRPGSNGLISRALASAPAPGMPAFVGFPLALAYSLQLLPFISSSLVRPFDDVPPYEV